VMRVAALIHSATGPDCSRWLTATDILQAATIGGARSAMLERETGSLEAGKKADLIALRTDTLAFMPLNDVRKHLVYCENGSSLELVMVNGEIVMRDGRLSRVDEDDIMAEVRERVPQYLAEHAKVEEQNRIFEPYFAEIHRRSTMQDVGLNRYAGDVGAWPGTNRT
jgi:5-methylthioadenosine/S-adenosylhomocysteine deaminase